MSYRTGRPTEAHLWMPDADTSDDGRDRKPARCVLLFCSDDIERQFKLSAYSRPSKREIAAILRALPRSDGWMPAPSAAAR